MDHRDSARYPQDRLGLFLDGPSLYASSKVLGFEVDYKKLLDFFNHQGRVVRAYYYTAFNDDAEFTPIRPLIDWLDYNGYSVVTKPTKEFIDHLGRRKVKGNMDVELAIDMLELAPHLDRVVLFSGDGEFRRLIEAVQRRGVRATVVSTFRSQPPMIAGELRRQADLFLDLAALMHEIGRPVARGQRDAEIVATRCA
jgi:uncharacterized LabA/DUF88 family protein